ncbi:MAG: pseudouridine synthase [Bacteroidales bacterium]|nr:pseudouridine synthase [Bacteroidales bacterium]MDY0286939.1 pseudouridine synthase [Bacteroidales bacterium]HPE85878.1 pseudouridine synthase [Bacteroidales bacterium]
MAKEQFTPNTNRNNPKKEGMKPPPKNKKYTDNKPSEYKPGKRKNPEEGLVRLNKYIADSGICSRREADTLIQAGVISINGKVITALGTKVGLSDVVTMSGENLRREKLKYVLLNKPKGFITTVKDPRERKTVMQLVEQACKERIVPVGRLDRNTTGLLLFTNDGDLAKKLTHPKHKVRKIYLVELNKPLTKNDFLAISEGITLEDGQIAADKIAFVNPDKKNTIGIEIHSGKNHIVRRIFEHLGYEVVKLDRTMFAGLTKKEIPRGKFRHLTDQEVKFLKML